LKSSLGENAAAGQVGIDSYRECPVYRIFGIAAFTPAHPALAGRGILQHSRKGNSWVTTGKGVERGKVFFTNAKNVILSYPCSKLYEMIRFRF